jgi:hypothetical protein
VRWWSSAGWTDKRASWTGRYDGPKGQIIINSTKFKFDQIETNAMVWMHKT